MVGAVEIENNAERNFKDLTEAMGDSKTLGGNGEEPKGILIGLAIASRSFRPENLSLFFAVGRLMSVRV